MLFLVEDHIARCRAPGELRVTYVAHDREQPGAAIAAPKPTRVTHRTHETLLHRVLRVLVVAQEPARQVVGVVEPAEQALLEFLCFFPIHQPPFSSRSAVVTVNHRHLASS